ncbi:helix-turn-helix domain-containing protein [Flagellimonas aurea]|uniref:helix-turn-helix domain-containing protein n=1 Tax=Flagellimonas aurea TaxID=2915619 RepID=UPI0035D0E72A
MDYVSAFSFWTKAILPVKIVETAIPSELNLLHFIFIGISLLGAGVGSYLIFLKKHNLYMGIFMIAMSTILLELTLLWWDGVLHIPKIPFYTSIMFLLGPSLFLYIEGKVYPNKKTTFKTLLYFSFFLVSLLLMLILTNTSDNITDVGLRGLGIKLLNSYYLKGCYFAVFWILILKQYFKYRKRIDIMDRNWLRTLVLFFFTIFLISIVGALFKNEFSLIHITRYIIAYFFSVFIIIISFLLYLFPAIVTEPLQIRLDKDQIKEKYQNSGLTTAMASALRLQLLNSMEDKVFLDSALSLEILAEKLNTDRYSLSQVINQEFNKNFYEFINDYRINECLARIDENPHQIDSISDLIYASGFNNKVSFYNAFKKRKSMTPVQYIKALNQ